MNIESIESDPMTVTQPHGLRVDLYPHQLTSIYEMEKLEHEQVVYVEDDCKRETTIGILADDTGYGKTLSMIGLICRDKMSWDLSQPYKTESISSQSLNRIKTRRYKYYDRVKTNLILISPSIVEQWQKELEKTTLKVFTVLTRKSVDIVDLNSYDVVLVIPNIYNRLVSTFPHVAWKRFIFDEPGHLRVPGMREVICGFFWMVTATPNAIISMHKNVKISFMKDIIGPGWYDVNHIFGGMIVKNKSSYIKSSFRMPKTHHIFHHCTQSLRKILTGFIDNELEEMIAADNIDDVISRLGGVESDSRSVVELVKRSKEKEIDIIDVKIGSLERELECLEKGEEESVDRGENVESARKEDDKEGREGKEERINERIRECREKRNRLLLHILTIQERFEEAMKGVCHICLTDLESPVLEPGCQNLFCSKCLLSWLNIKSACPLCRGSVDVSGLVYVKVSETGNEEDGGDKNGRKEKYKRRLTKPEKVIEIVQEKSDGCFLIFSSYDNTFEPILRALKENDIEYSLIRGNVKNRSDSIKRFRDGIVRVLFLNSTHNGAGINLQEATDIILYHDMNEYTETQILGRANRIGRVGELTVHHLRS